ADGEVQGEPIANDRTADISVDCPFVIWRLVRGERVSSIEFVVLKCRREISVQCSHAATLDDFCLRATRLRTIRAVGLARFYVERIIRDTNLLDASFSGAFLRTFGAFLGGFSGSRLNRCKVSLELFPRVFLHI